MHNVITSAPFQVAPLPRRLAALLYDALLLLALLLVATVPWALAARGELIAPLARAAYQAYLLGVSAVFFGWFWTHGGQTLGMRAWRVQVVADNATAVTVRAAAVRFGVGLISLAAFGLGFWWTLIDRDRKTWHDRAAHTRVVLLPKRP